MKAPSERNFISLNVVVNQILFVLTGGVDFGMLLLALNLDFPQSNVHSGTKRSFDITLKLE